MKKQILSFLFVLSAVLLISTSAYAQPSTPQSPSTTTTALDGSTVLYTVTNLTAAQTKYVWKLSGGSKTIDGTAYTAGTSLTKIICTNDPANSVSIKWDDSDAGTVYYLDVYVIDANGCYSEMKRTEITINKATLNIVASQATTTCSFLTGVAPGIKGNATTNTYDNFTVNVSSNGGITPASITYDILDSNGTTVLVNRPAEVTLLTGSFIVDLDATFVNASALSKDFFIKLKSATDASNNPMDVGVTTAKITILPLPVINFQ